MNNTIMAIDAGFCHSGYAILEADSKSKFGARVIEIGLVETEKVSRKHAVRVADDNISRCQKLFQELKFIAETRDVKGLVVEIPTGGSKSATATRAMALSAGVMACLAAAVQLPAEWTTPMDGKKALAKKANANKDEMINASLIYFPELKQLFEKNKICRGKQEHISDSIGAYLSARNGNVVRLVFAMGQQPPGREDDGIAGFDTEP